MLGFVERGGVDHRAVPRILGDALGDGGVHPLGIDGRDVRLDLLVAVLPPDENADLVGRTCGHVISFDVVGRSAVADNVACYFTAPPVAPAAMYFWAMTSRMIAGIEASIAVAITALQFEMCAPR